MQPFLEPSVETTAKHRNLPTLPTLLRLVRVRETNRYAPTLPLSQGARIQSRRDRSLAHCRIRDWLLLPAPTSRQSGSQRRRRSKPLRRCAWSESGRSAALRVEQLRSPQTFPPEAWPPLSSGGRFPEKRFCAKIVLVPKSPPRPPLRVAVLPFTVPDGTTMPSDPLPLTVFSETTHWLLQRIPVPPFPVNRDWESYAVAWKAAGLYRAGLVDL
jgi:hypothetical protein